MNTQKQRVLRTVRRVAVLSGLFLFQYCSSQRSSNNSLPVAPQGSLARLNGNYAFFLTGYDANGPQAVAGAFIADGNGNLTTVVEDINRGSGVIQKLSFTGTYVLHGNNRGNLFLNSVAGNIIYRIVMDTPGNGHLIEFDGTSGRGSGMFVKQDPSAFSLASFNGSFALGFAGTLGGGRVGAVGRFDSNSTGTLTNSVLDVGTPGTNLGSLPFSGSLGAIDNNGRGLASFNVTGAPWTSTLNFAFYVVSATEAFFVELDTPSASVPLLSGTALNQTAGPFSSASWNAAGILYATGSDPSIGSAATVVTLGQLTADGAGNLTGVVDQDAAGSMGSNQSFTGTYTIASNGRGTATLPSGLAAGQAFSFYVTGANSALLLEGTPTAPSQDVQTGWLAAQTGGPFSNATLGGSFAFGTLVVPSAAVRDTFGVLALDGAGSIVTGKGSIQDETTPTAEFPDERLSGSYSVGSNGRGTLTFSAPSTGTGVFYIVSPNQFVGIPPFTSARQSPALYVAER